MQCQRINYILYCEICQYTSKCGFNDENEVGTYLRGRDSYVVDVGHITCRPRAQSGLMIDTMPAHKYSEISQYTSKCCFNDENEVGMYVSGRGSCVVDSGTSFADLGHSPG